MGVTDVRRMARAKRKRRIRKRIIGTPKQPRLSVFRSASHIYAQIIDDTAGRTLAASSSLEKAVREQYPEPATSEPPPDAEQVAETPQSSADPESKPTSGKIMMAEIVGKMVAQRAIEKGMRKIVFDRNGYLYHGRVRAVADGARKAGLVF